MNFLTRLIRYFYHKNSIFLYEFFLQGFNHNLREEFNSILNLDENYNKTKQYQSLNRRQNDDIDDENPQLSEQDLYFNQKIKLVNWKEEKIVTILSLYISPMRAYFLDFIQKKELKKAQKAKILLSNQEIITLANESDVTQQNASNI